MRANGNPPLNLVFAYVWDFRKSPALCHAGV